MSERQPIYFVDVPTAPWRQQPGVRDRLLFQAPSYADASTDLVLVARMSIEGAIRCHPEAVPLPAGLTTNCDPIEGRS